MQNGCGQKSSQSYKPTSLKSEIQSRRSVGEARSEADTPSVEGSIATYTRSRGIPRTDEGTPRQESDSTYS